jgi:hypothetical protein
MKNSKCFLSLSKVSPNHLFCCLKVESFSICKVLNILDIILADFLDTRMRKEIIVSLSWPKFFPELPHVPENIFYMKYMTSAYTQSWVASKCRIELLKMQISYCLYVISGFCNSVSFSRNWIYSWFKVSLTQGIIYYVIKNIERGQVSFWNFAVLHCIFFSHLLFSFSLLFSFPIPLVSFLLASFPRWKVL